MRADRTATVRELVDAARAEGRAALTEIEALRVAAALGIGVPHHVVLGGPEDAASLDLGAFPGERVVLKIVSSDVPHKSDVGGVRFLVKDREAIRDAVGEMARAFAGQAVQGYSVNAFVPHDASLGGEVLLGARWTDDFGPVVTFGPGGAHAEFLARNLKAGCNTAILSPLLASPGAIERALAQTAVTPAVTGRLRGPASRITREDLRGLVARLLDLAAATMPDLLEEFEINPLVFGPEGPVALDALARLGAPRPAPAPPRPPDGIANLLVPESIALVGVSRGMNPGRRILENVLRAGFDPGRVTVVKEGLERLDGCRCVPGLASLEGPVDLLVVCVEARQVPDVVEEAIRLSVARSLILIAGGLGERRGTEGHARRVEAAIWTARASLDGGPVVNGGNCLGVRSVPGRYDTLFIPPHKLDFTGRRAAPLAVISQSGAFAVSRASQWVAFDPRYLITLGNQLDLTVGDYLTHLEGEEAVRVFACYVEGFRPLDGARWLEAVARITASGRPVVLYRAGRTPMGAEATASHTASIAGDYAVTRALAEAAGALVAGSLADFDDLVRLAVLLDGKGVRG
ncbi:MAG: acetate--CoA ligase family protein, partial [Planctomycetota bacterium]